MSALVQRGGTPHPLIFLAVVFLLLLGIGLELAYLDGFFHGTVPIVPAIKSPALAIKAAQ